MKDYKTKDNKLVGTEKDNILYMRRDSKKHKFAKFLDGYGMDCDVYDEMMNDNEVKQVWLLEVEMNQIFKSTIEDWKERGVVKDFRYGEQRFLPLSEWSISNPHINEKYDRKSIRNQNQ